MSTLFTTSPIIQSNCRSVENRIRSRSHHIESDSIRIHQRTLATMTFFNVCTEKLIKRLMHLVQLKIIPETNHDEELLRYFGGKVLISFYHVGLAGYRFSNDERRIVGPLLQTALPRLNVKLYHEIDEFPTSSYRNVCIIRSGLQYLLDNYSSFPTPNGVLQEALTSWVKELDLQRYDDCLASYEEDPHQPVGNLSYYVYRTPNHHWWWRERFALPTSANDEDGEDDDNV